MFTLREACFRDDRWRSGQPRGADQTPTLDCLG